jgi:hypothetical protein
MKSNDKQLRKNCFEENSKSSKKVFLKITIDLKSKKIFETLSLVKRIKGGVYTRV